MQCTCNIQQRSFRVIAPSVCIHNIPETGINDKGNSVLIFNLRGKKSHHNAAQHNMQVSNY